MTGETQRNISGWTVDTYSVHNEALRAAEDKFQHERDRRYAEVATEREKALLIEKTARAEALQLAREIQTYKDEKANELREQINAERGLYATKSDLQASTDKIEESLKPIQEFVSRSSGQRSGLTTAWGVIIILLGLAVSISVPFLTRTAPTAAAPQVIYVPAPPNTMLPTTPPQQAPR